MQIVVTRTRASGPESLFQYMLLVPFDQLPEERRARIHYRTDFGGGRRSEPHARLAEVIAPIAHLRLPPGLEQHREAAAISAVARQLEALLVGAVFPEMTSPIIPPLFRLATDPGDAQVFTRVDDLTDRYAELAPRIANLTAAELGLSG